ncbi:hypothetical protein SK128_027180, partial [Halocaridina rubra]
DKLPSNLGYLLHEIPKGVSKSILRRESFKQLFMVMDAYEERKRTPLPFQNLSYTRWLVRGKVIYNILINWEELKAYFSVVLPIDPVNFLYFQFVSPVVTDFERLNSLFQTTDADPEYLVKCYFCTISLQNRILNKNAELLPVNKIDYGAKFTQELNTYIERQPHSAQVVEIAADIKQRCTYFLCEAL